MMMIIVFKDKRYWKIIRIPTFIHTFDKSHLTENWTFSSFFLFYHDTRQMKRISQWAYIRERAFNGIVDNREISRRIFMIHSDYSSICVLWRRASLRSDCRGFNAIRDTGIRLYNAVCAIHIGREAIVHAADLTHINQAMEFSGARMPRHPLSLLEWWFSPHSDISMHSPRPLFGFSRILELNCEDCPLTPSDWGISRVICKINRVTLNIIFLRLSAIGVLWIISRMCCRYCN